MNLLEITPALEKIAKGAQADGVEAEVLAVRRDRFSVSMHQGQVDKFDSGLSLCAGVRVIKDGAQGYCSSENLGAEALAHAYQEALQNAEFAARFSGSVNQTVNQTVDQTVALLGPNVAKAKGVVARAAEDWGHANDVEGKISLARRLERAALQYDTRIKSVPYNGYNETLSSVRIFNSKGVDCSYERGDISAYLYALANEDQDSRTASEVFYTNLENEFNPEELGSTAAAKALAKLKAEQPSTGNYPILFDANTASQLLGQLGDYLSGKAVVEKRSLFGTDLGQAIASPVLTIVDDPFLPLGPAARPFDSEGMPSRRMTVIEQGVLRGFFLNSIYARKLGMTNTGHAARSPQSELDIGPSNLVVEPGAESAAQLLRRHSRVIVINELSGFHAGFQEGSGDFSLQAEGELWEHGQRVVALRNFVVSGSFREFLRVIEAVASQAPRPTSSVITPEILVSRLSIAGRT